jgi:hypothetical protein
MELVTLNIILFSVVQDDWHIQSMPIAICLMVLGAHIKILFLNKVKIILLTKWSYMFPIMTFDY